MEAQDSIGGGSGTATNLSQQDIDRLYGEYQKSQSTAKTKSDDLYREYTKHQSSVTGNELRADPENKEKYDAYKQAVKSYYEAHGPDVVKDMMPDMSTPGHLWEGLKKFGTGFYQNVKTATGGNNALSAVGGAAGGALASVADTAAMPFTFSSWLKEKNLAGDGKYDEAAEVAAERMADMAKGTKWLESKLKPSSKEGAAAYEATKPVAGLVLPIAAAKVLGAGASAAEMAQAAEAANAAKTAGVLETVGKVGGQVIGGAGGLVKAGPRGVIPAAQAGAKIGATAGKVAGELASASAEGGLIGGVMTGAQEPVGTPMSEGVGPGMALSAGMHYGIKGGSALKEKFAEEGVALKGKPSKEGPADLYADFEKPGGIIDIDQNRVAVEAKPGVGRQSQAFGGIDRPTFHEGLVKSYEKMEGNSKHSNKDDVIRFGYDPETQTLQVVMAKPTKGDAVPVDRYVYQRVTPELWQFIRESDSMSGALNDLAARGGEGILMGRVSITDRQLNSVVDNLNNGVLDFHPEWGFQKGSGNVRDGKFVKPQKPDAPIEGEPAPLGPTEKTNLEKEGWKDRFLSGVFKGAGRIAGQAVKENVARGKQILESFKKGPSDVENLGTDYPFPESKKGPKSEIVEEMPSKQQTAPAETQQVDTPAQQQLNEPAETTRRRQDFESAMAEQEAAAAEEQRLRQSPQGAEALKRQLGVQEEGLKPQLRREAPEQPKKPQETESFNTKRNRILDEFKRDGIPINRETLSAANELANIPQRHYGDLKRAIYEEFAPEKATSEQASKTAPLKSFRELDGKTEQAVSKPIEEPVKPTEEQKLPEPPPEAAPEPAKPETPPPAPASPQEPVSTKETEPVKEEAAPATTKPVKTKKKALQSLGAGVEQKPEGKVVTPTKEKERQVSELADKKQLAAQKKYITQALETLIEDAPDRPNVGSKKDQAEYDKAADNYDRYSKGTDRYSKQLTKDAERVMDLFSDTAEKVTINVPGDGTFKVVNSKRSLESFGDRIESKFGKGLTQANPRNAKTAKGLPELKGKEREQAIAENKRLKAEEEAQAQASEQPKTAEPTKQFAADKYSDAVDFLNGVRADNLTKQALGKIAENLVKRGVATSDQVSAIKKPNIENLKELVNENSKKKR